MDYNNLFIQFLLLLFLLCLLLHQHKRISILVSKIEELKVLINK